MLKTYKYDEGPEALERFERGVAALFKEPKDAVQKAPGFGEKLNAEC